MLWFSRKSCSQQIAAVSLYVSQNKQGHESICKPKQARPEQVKGKAVEYSIAICHALSYTAADCMLVEPVRKSAEAPAGAE